MSDFISWNNGSLFRHRDIVAVVKCSKWEQGLYSREQIYGISVKMAHVDESIWYFDSEGTRNNKLREFEQKLNGTWVEDDPVESGLSILAPEDDES
jgi:hypothetical protein